MKSKKKKTAVFNHHTKEGRMSNVEREIQEKNQ